MRLRPAIRGVSPSRDSRRGLGLLPRPVHARRVARYGPAVGRSTAARRRNALRRDLAPDRRKHRHDHPHRPVAPPWRGWLLQGTRAVQSRQSQTRRQYSMTCRLRLAIPNKGRLVEPTVRLLRDAGLVFEAGERALVARVQNFDLDILFVRTNDIVEFINDGVAELGVTGLDLVAESGTDAPLVRKLGYGRCRLTLAVPNDSPFRAAEDLAGLRVATSHMGLTKRFFAERAIPVDVIPVSGAAEVAPRLGLAEAIVDLVSTGSTMVVNGLRPVEEVLASEAVLLANKTALAERPDVIDSINTMLSATLAARDRKYLMMNAPKSKLAELENLLPGLESPSIIPLAHEGMIAIHSVVEADQVWSLLPRLKAAGASGILILPIEKLVS